MQERSIVSSLLLGALLCVGLSVLGALLAEGIIKFREADRVVSVKGLSEKEMPADVAIWPIRFTEVNNDLSELFGSMESKNEKIQAFLRQQLGGAAGGDQLDAQRVQGLGKFDDAGFVRDRKKCVHGEVAVGWGG